MSQLNLILPQEEIPEPDQFKLQEIFRDPLVVKYLRYLAIQDNKELLGLAVLDMPADSVAKRHTMVQGRLSAYATLLSLSETKEQ